MSSNVNNGDEKFRPGVVVRVMGTWHVGIVVGTVKWFDGSIQVIFEDRSMGRRGRYWVDQDKAIAVRVMQPLVRPNKNEPF